MTGSNLGNQLNSIVREARGRMFDQGEFAQLTYGAFDIAANSMQGSDQEEIEIKFPIGYKPDKTVLESVRKYNKAQLLSKYQYLAFNQLAINAILQLVTLVENMLTDVVRAVVVKYPRKLSGKRTITIQSVLESMSLEEMHLKATDALLNELTYKSPSDFAIAIEEILGLKLLECPAFHKYIEIKASRDIYIHNRGVVNDIYIRKSGSHARCKIGMSLPADLQYFLESYEFCIQVAEWLENELHARWHSSEYEVLHKHQIELALPAAQEQNNPDLKGS